MEQGGSVTNGANLFEVVWESDLVDWILNDYNHFLLLSLLTYF